MMRTWITVKLDKGQLGLTCPSAQCRGKTVVNRKLWLHGAGKEYLARPCPYCFKSFRIPVEMLNKRMKEKALKDQKRNNR